MKELIEKVAAKLFDLQPDKLEWIKETKYSDLHEEYKVTYRNRATELIALFNPMWDEIRELAQLNLDEDGVHSIQLSSKILSLLPQDEPDMRERIARILCSFDQRPGAWGGYDACLEYADRILALIGGDE